ncbi:MAG: RelA/SpoT family protein [Candidatus Geothermincolia bacterium]
MPPTIDEIVTTTRRYDPRSDAKLIRRAYEFARLHHQNQYRRSGEDFIEHPVGVAAILADLEMDTNTIASALLHDVVEDTDLSVEDLEKEFGAEIAHIVDGVTKLERLEFRSNEEQQAENVRKMLIAMAADIRVILIKLADRLHNMQTLEHLPPEKQEQKARETLEIYAPLAHRLGINQLRWQLEDLAFATLYPLRYKEIQQMVAQRRAERESYVEEVTITLRERLKGARIQAQVNGRVKHFYSIYTKMISRGVQFDEIYDLFAVRVIADTVKDCYSALGLVHSLWKPLPGRFKDYIAMPKFNMYQSLHTVVMGPQGRPLEIQIRTDEMHRTAEYGIAAHWHYKDSLKKQQTFRDRLSWLKGIMEWQQELRDPQEFMESLKIDLFRDEVFVFTPKGDVMALQAGATPIDFAYAIHTEVGHHCVGSRVNGKIVPLEYRLRNGDIVEVITSKTSTGPSQDWLQIARSTRARNKIRQWFSKERRQEEAHEGREELLKELRRAKLPAQKILASDILTEVYESYKIASLDDFYAALGSGRVSLQQAMQRISQRWGPELPEEDEQLPQVRSRRAPLHTQGIKVEDVENVMVRVGRCCNPLPPDDIVGFVTRGRGVSVHRQDCPNAKHMAEEGYETVGVEWDSRQPGVFQVEIEVDAIDRPRLLKDITTIMGEFHVNILSASLTINRENVAVSRFVFELGNIAHLEDILRNIRKVDAVFDAFRVLPAPH